MSPLPFLVFFFICLISMYGIKEYQKSPADPDEMHEINGIVKEASNSPDGKALLDFIKEKQVDGINKQEYEHIVNAYQDWKLFYSLKDAEAKQAVVPTQIKGVQ